MTLIYLVSARDQVDGKSICVRAEIMINRNPSIALYRSYPTRDQKRAKMTAMIDILRRLDFPKNESISIYTDDEQIPWEWDELCKDEKSELNQDLDWIELKKLLSQFSIRPDIKDKGCLTTAMRSDMKLHMVQEWEEKHGHRGYRKENH